VHLKRLWNTKQRSANAAVFVAILLATQFAVAQATSGQGNAPSQNSAPQSPAQSPAIPTVPSDNQSGVPSSVALSPAVIMARGTYGQGLTQTLTLSNNTNAEFAFEMEAQDVLIQNGQRVFVAAGETQNSIAASAVFSQKQVIVKPHSTITVDVRLTLPAQTSIRAVVAIFRGTNKLPTSNSAVGMTASLGALITFNLSDNIKLQPDAMQVSPASETSNLTVSQWITNVGTEPVLPEGMAVVLDAKGNLVAKIPLQPQRLLPGERLEFAAEYPQPLQPGDYKAMCTLQFEGKTLTSDAAFKVQ
jgi:hypothetical protein